MPELPPPLIGGLFTAHGSDKQTLGKYGRLYDALLAPIRDTAAWVLELGVLGGASLRAWRDYFPHGRIVVVIYKGLCSWRQASLQVMFHHCRRS